MKGTRQQRYDRARLCHATKFSSRCARAASLSVEEAGKSDDEPLLAAMVVRVRERGLRVDLGESLQTGSV